MALNPIDIRTSIGDAACYEQLAQESLRLADAALMCAKVIRQDNPTPEEADDISELVAAAGAIYACEQVIGICDCIELTAVKYMDSWRHRIVRVRSAQNKHYAEMPETGKEWVKIQREMKKSKLPKPGEEDQAQS